MKKSLLEKRLLKMQRSYRLTQTYSQLLEDFNKKMDHKILELSLLNEIAKVFATTAFDQHNIAGFLFTLLKKKFPVNLFSLLLVDGKEASLMFSSDEPLSESIKEKVRAQVVENFVKKTGEALSSDTVSLVEMMKSSPSNSANSHAKSVLAEVFFTPLVVSEKTIGIIGIVPDAAFLISEDDKKFLEILATQVALFVENDRIKETITRERNQLEEMTKELASSNQKLEERTAKLEIANKELDAFSYSMSHDLRAPLRHISGFIELLEKNAAAHLDEKGKHYVTTISKSARQMGELIDDLLVFSRMTRTQMSFSKVNLAVLVQSVIETFSTDLQDRAVVWKIENLPEISGDPSLLRVVFLNLISNAIKYSRPRSQATIEIGNASKDEKEWIFFVRDNGVGFDMQFSNKLFGVFQRLHSNSEFEGTGIGLASVQRIILRHGGKTWAEGKVGEGATIYFSLPRKELVS